MLQVIVKLKTIQLYTELDYPGFTVWLSCSQLRAIKFQYVAQRDNGSSKPNAMMSFSLIPMYRLNANKKTAKAYGMKYDGLAAILLDFYKIIWFSILKYIGFLKK